MRYGRQLDVQDKFMGKIRETDHVEPDFSNNKPINVDFEQILGFSKLLPLIYLGHQDGQDRFEVIWRTVIADTINGISPAPSHYAVEFEKLFMGAIKNVIHDNAVGNFENGDLLSTWSVMKDLGRLQDQSALDIAIGERTNETANFQKRVTDTMDKRRLFITDTGHVGCGDSRLSIGDYIVIIAGCSVPFLLRSGSSGKYILIGEAYIHGIMFGEHTSGPDAK